MRAWLFLAAFVAAGCIGSWGGATGDNSVEHPGPTGDKESTGFRDPDCPGLEQPIIGWVSAIQGGSGAYTLLFADDNGFERRVAGEVHGTTKPDRRDYYEYPEARIGKYRIEIDVDDGRSATWDITTTCHTRGFAIDISPDKLDKANFAV